DCACARSGRGRARGVAPGRGTRRRSWWNHYPWARPLKTETRVRIPLGATNLFLLGLPRFQVRRGSCWKRAPRRLSWFGVNLNYLARPARPSVAGQQLAVHAERPMELAGDSQHPRGREGDVHLHLALGRDVGVYPERGNADVVQGARLVLYE